MWKFWEFSQGNGSSESSEKRTSWVENWGCSTTYGSATSTSAVSGATKAWATATAIGCKGAGAAASPTGTGAGTIGKLKLTITGRGCSVIFYVATTVVGSSNKEGIFSSKSVCSPQIWPNDASLWKLSNLMTVRSSTRLCGVTGLERILWTHCV